MREDGKTREEIEAMYADGRFTDRTYASKSFPLKAAPDVPARFIQKVFDVDPASELETEGEGWLVRESPGGRVQVKLLVAREAGHVTALWIQRIRQRGSETVLRLHGDDARRFVELIRSLGYISVDGPSTWRIDDAVMAGLIASPESVSQLYERSPELFRKLITDDAAARDVVALEARRKTVDRFRTLIEDIDVFEEAVSQVPGRRPETVWRQFFESNPWILGTGLSGQFFTSWDTEKLEQVIAGSTVLRAGKRPDALMRTSGVIRWLTFGEFKTHRTDLLTGSEYRPGVWAPSRDLVGGVVQAQSTVRRALQDIGEALPGRAADGSDIPGDETWLTQPRSFLVIGHSEQLLGEEGGPHRDKVHAFEQYRRNLKEVRQCLGRTCRP